MLGSVLLKYGEKKALSKAKKHIIKDARKDINEKTKVETHENHQHQQTTAEHSLPSAPNTQTTVDIPAPDHTTLTYKDGQITAVLPYKNKKLNGQARFYKEGELTQIITYKDGVQHGPLSSYKKGLIFLIVHYQNGLKTGIEIAYDPEGLPKLYTEFLNGKKHGKQIVYKNGVMLELTHYTEDIKDGLFFNYFPNGMLQQTGTYKTGKLDGWITIFTDQGKIIAKNRYIDGVQVE